MKSSNKLSFRDRIARANSRGDFAAVFIAVVAALVDVVYFDIHDNALLPAPTQPLNPVVKLPITFKAPPVATERSPIFIINC